MATKLKTVPKNHGKKRPRQGPVQVPPATNGPAPPPQKRGRLYVEATDVREKADQLGMLAPTLGGPLSDLNYADQAEQEDDYVAEVDPLVGHAADVVQQDLLRYPEVCAAADVQPAAHQARADQVAAAGEAYVGAAQRDQDVQDGLMVLGTDNRKLREDLTQLVPRALAGGLIPDALVPMVRARWLRIESEMEKQAAKDTQQKKSTHTSTQASQAEQNKAQARENLLHTMLDLKADRPVDPMRAAEAIRTYDEVTGEQATQAEELLASQAATASDRRTGAR